jgi:hypothetical protein
LLARGLLGFRRVVGLINGQIEHALEQRIEFVELLARRIK